MLFRIFDRWSKSSSFTTNELTLLRMFLPVGNVYAERLFLQAIKAPYIERKRTTVNGYEAIIPYVVDDSMLIECDENIDSPTIAVTTSDGATLTFSVTILRGGFLRGIKGQIQEGTSWPKEWSIEFQSMRIPSGINTWIPQPIKKEVRSQSLDELFRWCGVLGQESDSFPNSDVIRVAEPATKLLIRACESRLESKLSPQYVQLVSITNGFGIQRGRPYEILGTLDIEFVNGAREWLCLTPLYEEGCVAIRCKDGIATNECFLLTGGENPNYIGDIKQHIRESLLCQAKNEKGSGPNGTADCAGDDIGAQR